MNGVKKDKFSFIHVNIVGAFSFPFCLSFSLSLSVFRGSPWIQLMELLPFFLAKGQHQQGTCSNVTGSLADPLHPSGYDGRLEAAAPAGVGHSSIHQGSRHVCPDLRGPILELRVGI